jgi:pimeloyl-ACP methyl ester carboxylesterase
MPRPIPYGPAPEQAGDLWLPDAPGGPLPVAALWHGGGYVPEADRAIMEPIARDLCLRGWAAWNLEYRRMGSGGGWPQTFTDVADGLDRLAELRDEGEPLDLDRVVAVGFSAGAPLALWSAARHEGRVRAAAVVSQAGIVDLETVARDDGIQAQVGSWLGDPDEDPEVYTAANPAGLLPLGVPILLVHGEDDENVPPRMSTRFAALAREAGDDAEAVLVPGTGHFDHLDPGSEAWAVVTGWLDRLPAPA